MPRPRSRSGREGPRLSVARDGEHLDLVVDGVPYSSFHRERPWTGYVWDALAATVLLVDAPKPRVLLLGCAAGTALVLLRRASPEARLTAVELSPEVLDLARERFGLDRLGAEVVLGDGVEYVRSCRRRFDLVLDDMFAPAGKGIRRPVDDETAHLRRISRLLAEGGVAATNSTTDDDPPGLLAAVRSAHRAVFPHRVEVQPRKGYNVVWAGSGSRLDVDRARSRAATLPPEDRDALDAVGMRPG